MLKIFKAGMAACIITGVLATQALALPNPAPFEGAIPALPADTLTLQKEELQQVAQRYCYNRYTGQFLHWGSCRRARPVRRTPGRTYCYNRRTGAFINWGACRR